MMRRRLIGLIVAIVLFAASFATAAAQARSRMDLQLGAWFERLPVDLGVRSAVETGVTGWLGDHSGVAVRGFWEPGGYRVWGATSEWDSLFIGSQRGFDLTYRHRGFVGDFETDFGIGYGVLTYERTERAQDGALTRRTLHRADWLAVDFLVGRRLHERFGVKAGLAWRVVGADAIAGIWKVMMVVPLGSR